MRDLKAKDKDHTEKMILKNPIICSDLTLEMTNGIIFFQGILFDRLRRESPDALQKVHSSIHYFIQNVMNIHDTRLLPVIFWWINY